MPAIANTRLLELSCLGGFTLYLVFTIWRVFFHPLSKYPGPRLWAASRLPWAYHLIKGDLWRVLGDLHEKYGTTVRIGPDEITTVSPTAWEDIYASKPLLPKDPYSQTPPLNGAHSLFTAAGDTHRRIRRTLVNGFSDKALREQAPIVEKYASALINKLQRESERRPDGSLDLEKFYGYATFDIVTDLSFGECFHSLEETAETSWITRFFLHAKFGTIRNCLSRFWPLDTILGLIFLRITRKNRVRNWRISGEKIERRLSKGDMTGIRSDFLSPVIGRISEDGKTGITKEEVLTNGLAVVIANCQLTTVALSTATYFLLKEPRALERLTAELKSRFESLDEITVHATEHLPYLNAVIDETLRIHHPTPISLPRVTFPKGQVIDGQFVPGNCVVGINLQNIQNSPMLWTEPRRFQPERFLPSNDIRYEKCFDGDVKAAFEPFSIGPRNCLGRKVFLAQARVILARVFWRFEITMADPNASNWLDQKAYLVFEPKPLYVKLM